MEPVPGWRSVSGTYTQTDAAKRQASLHLRVRHLREQYWDVRDQDGNGVLQLPDSSWLLQRGHCVGHVDEPVVVLPTRLTRVVQQLRTGQGHSLRAGSIVAALQEPRFDELQAPDFAPPLYTPQPLGTAYISEDTGGDRRFTVTWQVMFEEWLVLYYQPPGLVLSLDEATAWSRSRAVEVLLQRHPDRRPRPI